MRNGFFQLVNAPGGFGIKIFPPKDGGAAVSIQELVHYLDDHNINYVLEDVKKAASATEDTVLPLGAGACPAINEIYTLNVAADFMSVTARFLPASETGSRMSVDEFVNDMQYRNVRFGILRPNLEKHFGGPGFYCADFPVAMGKPPRQGKDAELIYYFNTDLHAQPEMSEDGSVDYFNLNLINSCKQGDVLAKIIPEDPGDYGMNIQGARLKPRDVRRRVLHVGHGAVLSPDRLSVTAGVSGHVYLAGDDVIVSNVYEVDNVGNATGNIDFDGCVRVKGNVSSNFVVKATGDIFVSGVVEGALLEAGGNITIAQGMKGMGSGVLKAGGNIICKFLENATATANGYVNTESILHSNVSAGTVVNVTSSKGFITGGRVQAEELVEVRTLGAVMGANTIVEVGVNPEIKARFLQCQKDVAEIIRQIKQAQPVIQSFTEKKSRGANFSAEQLKYVKETAQLLETKKQELEQKSAEMNTLSEAIDPNRPAMVKVTGEVYPGTTIVIGDVSMNVQSSYRYCRFQKQDGDVKMMPL